MTTLFRNLLVMLAPLVPIAALGQAAPPQGVWGGSIGARAVVACFNKGSPHPTSGSYYYIDFLTPIALRRVDHDALWHEAGDTGRWELSAPMNGVVSGTWRSAKADRELPITLSIVDGSDDGFACARDAYNTRLERQPQVEKGHFIRVSSTRSYRTLRFAGQETLELHGPDAALSQLNSLLQPDASREAVQAFFDQRRHFLGQVGHPSNDERRTRVTFWDSNFITIEFYVWAAGTGSSGISIEYRTWNVKTAQEVDPWEWIDSAGTGSDSHHRFMRFLQSSSDAAAPDCVHRHPLDARFAVVPSRSGLTFEEDDRHDACRRTIHVPFPRLAPFLSAAGKRAVESITTQR